MLPGYKNYNMRYYSGCKEKQPLILNKTKQKRILPINVNRRFQYLRQFFYLHTKGLELRLLILPMSIY
jgi:hypothetical protein